MVLDATLTTPTPARKGQARLLAVGSFVLVVAIVAIAALISDRSLTPDQRIAVFAQSYQRH
jgi:hypothetical protein